MKKFFTLGLFLLLGCVSLKAVPAKQGVKRVVTLADGATVELTLRGDEHYSFYSGNDGFAYRKKSLQFERFSLEEAYHEWGSRMKLANKPRRAKTRGIGDSKGSLTGKRKGLVILMAYPDQSFSIDNPQPVFNDFFNKENYSDFGMSGSVKDYFKAQSYGQFELDFDVVGPFVTNASMAYYGAHDGDNNDSHAPEIIREACMRADDQVNFADYDWDGDGEVEQVFVVYAGYAEAQGGAPETIWPHEWHLAAGGIELNLDGVKIDTYACSAELKGANGTDLDGIGTACHEFSHCLGLPDLYDTGDQNNFGMSYWDVMSGGSYNNDSRTPAGFTSYERMFAGWLTPKELSGDMTQISNMKALVDSPEAYILYNDANKNEYYLLENRQQKQFDAGLYGHGLLVLHVDYSANVWRSNMVNNTSDHQRLTIIPADGALTNSIAQLAGDPFPGRKGVTALTNYTEPSAATLYNENADGRKLMNKPIDSITESEDGLISFVALRPELLALSADDIKEVEGEGAFTISWPAVSGAVKYQLSLSEKGIASNDPSEALEREFNFDEFVSNSTGFTDCSSNMAKYGLTGWNGSKIFTSPGKMKIGTSKEAGSVKTNTWNVPGSTDMTVVMGAAPVKEGDVVKGTITMYSYNQGDTQAQGETQKFEITADGKQVFNFSTDDQKFWIALVPESQMYLNYFAIYDGIWNASQLGLQASVATRALTRATTSALFETETNSIELQNLDVTKRYYYRVRSVGEAGDISAWSEEKSFVFSSSGINGIAIERRADNKIYDLQGRSYGTDANGLKKGIYIINGKKVVK